MGLMMGFLGGVGKGVADVSKSYLDNEFEAMKAERIAEATSRLRLSEEATIRQRGKDDAAAERTRVDTKASELAAERAGGLMVPEAAASYEAMRATDPEGAQVGIDALKKAHAPTLDDRMLAEGKTTELARLQRDDITRADTKANTDADNARADRDLALREGNLDRANALNDIQVKTAKLAYERAVEEQKVPVAVDRQYKALSEAYNDTAKIIAKSRAEGSFNDVTAAPLLAEQAARAQKMAALMEPYTPAAARSATAGAGGGSKYNSDTGEVTVDGKVTATIAKGLKSREDVQAALAKSKPAPAKVVPKADDAQPVQPVVPRTGEEAALAAQGGATAADRIGWLLESVRDIRKKTNASVR